MTTEIRCIRKNIMGTVSFEMKTASMRKFQDFIVYPKHEGDTDNRIIIQSDKRIGRFDTVKNSGTLSKSYPNGAYFVHLNFGEMEPLTLQGNDLKSLKLAIIDGVGASVGSSFVTTDNSAAINVL
jgi:hypothetical protein